MDPGETIDSLRVHVRRGLDRFCLGQYFIEFGLQETAVLIPEDANADDLEASGLKDKNCPFQVFLKAVASEIVKEKGVTIGHTKRIQDYLEILQAFAGEWVDYIRKNHLNLHKAIVRCDFKKAIDFLEKAKDPTALAKMVEAKSGRLAIHEALASSAYLYKTEYTKIILLLVEHWPKGLKFKDKRGSLPIHYAVNNQYFDCHELLIEECPESAKVKDGNGMLPIHYALKNRLVGCQGLLFERYPESAEVKDGEGNLPIRYAAQFGAKFEIIKTLVQEYPKGLEVPTDSGGSLPIHLVCFDSSPCPDVFRYLIEAHPDGLKHPDKEGNLPLHIAASKFDSKGIWVLVKDMISLYDEGLRHKNKKGQLPIHLCQNDGVFNQMAISCPDSLCMPGTRPLRPVVKFLLRKSLPMCRATILQRAFDTLEPRLNQSAALEEKVEELKDAKTKLDTEKRRLEAAFAKEKDKLTKAFAIEKQQTKTKQDSEKRRLEAAFAKEKDEMNKAFALGKQQTKANEDAEKLQLKESFAKEKEEMIKESAREKQQWDKDKTELEAASTKLKKDKQQLEGSLELCRKVAAEWRRFDKSFLERVLADQSQVSMDELKTFASSLKSRVDVIKAKLTPTAKPSMIQIMFASFIKDPDLTKPSLVDCIQSLDAELTGLESDMEEGFTSNPDPPGTGSTEQDGSPPAGRPAKRPRVSMP